MADIPYPHADIGHSRTIAILQATSLTYISRRRTVAMWRATPLTYASAILVLFSSLTLRFMFRFLFSLKMKGRKSRQNGKIIVKVSSI